MRVLIAILSLSLLLVACGPVPTPERVEVTREIVREITVEVPVTVIVEAPPAPTYTPYPTYTPAPTYTPPPTVAPPTATPKPTDTPKPSATPTSAAPEMGTRANPLPFGTGYIMPDGFVMQIMAFDEDAWPEVQAENKFNDPPLAGRRMVMLTIGILNKDTPKEPEHWSDMNVALLGSYNKPWTPFGDESSCGVVPNDLDIVELYHGGLAQGNICFQIPDDETDLLLRYEYGWDKYAYFRATP